MPENSKSTSIVIADDEPLLAEYIQQLIRELWPEADIIALANTGDQAQQAIENHKPDVAFLDIQMPGKDGLEIARSCAQHCRIVFVTSYQQHAVEAFDLAAVDYLLKPVTRERLSQCIAKIQRQRMSEQPPDYQQLISAINSIEHNKNQYIHWIRAGLGDRVELIPTDSIVYFQAQDKYTSVYTADNEYLIRSPIKKLGEQLNPEQFWQIHRALLVQIAEIAKAEKALGGRYHLHLRSRPEVLTVSRKYGHLFRLESH